MCHLMNDPIQNMYRTLSFHIIIVLIAKMVSCENCTNRIIACSEATTCQDCLRRSSCCNWCFQPDYHDDRCYVAAQATACGTEYRLENEPSEASVVKNASFSDIGTNREAVQLNPQEIDVKLHSNEPLEFEFRYQAARNFPLELYYLLDLSISMRYDLETITELGVNLTQLLTQLTESYKIGFGAYVEKTAMPFYLVDPASLQNPCRWQKDTCKPGYAFRHHLNFSKVDRFIEELKNSSLSANVDNLESGFDALMQILWCKEQIGWSENSRKLVLIATESTMHMAGDGILLGATKRNTKNCLINSKGEYEQSLQYDYPSLEEIYHRLNDRKVNVILAIKHNSWEYYQHVHNLMPDSSFLGKLEQGSKNILDLVKEGYYKFIRNAKFSLNNSNVEGLEVKFFGKCGGPHLAETDTCNNIVEGKPVTFKVQLKLNNSPKYREKTLHIEEKNINEKIKLNLNFIEAKCYDKDSCQGAPNLPCKNGGTSVCGACECTAGWTGELCAERCDNIKDACNRFDNGTRTSICFGRGDCLCGKCDCRFPFAGKLCEYACPHDNKARCSGNGECTPDGCKCNQYFTGDNCNCSVFQDNCKVLGASIFCNGHGICECNQCKCEPGYSGAFCEICDNCEGFCNIYAPCVINKIQRNMDACTIENATVSLEMVDSFGEDQQKCLYQYYAEDGVRCQTSYTYILGKGVNVKYTNPSCDRALPASLQVGIGLVSVLVLGILFIAFYKLRIWYADRQEYIRFKETRSMMSQEMNPIYKSPINQYVNPMAQSSSRNKTD